VVAVSTAIAANNGLLIRNRAAFERARNIQAIIFDKTGTLTEGKFGVTDTIMFSGSGDEKELLKYAASVEAHSNISLQKGSSRHRGMFFLLRDSNQFQARVPRGVLAEGMYLL